jgi:hypothetical protein
VAAISSVLTELSVVRGDDHSARRSSSQGFRAAARWRHSRPTMLACLMFLRVLRSPPRRHRVRGREYYHQPITAPAPTTRRGSCPRTNTSVSCSNAAVTCLGPVGRRLTRCLPAWASHALCRLPSRLVDQFCQVHLDIQDGAVKACRMTPAGVGQHIEQREIGSKHISSKATYAMTGSHFGETS